MDSTLRHNRTEITKEGVEIYRKMAHQAEPYADDDIEMNTLDGDWQFIDGKWVGTMTEEEEMRREATFAHKVLKELGIPLDPPENGEPEDFSKYQPKD